jgi:hypothetical protein
MNPPSVIRVTADHIANGKRGRTDRCPIALAIRTQWPDVAVDVHPREAAAQDTVSFLRYRAMLPDEARDFVAEYDDGGDVDPFEFAVKWTDEDGAAV